MSDEEVKQRFVTVKTYAERCGVGVHAIYRRIKLSDDGVYEEGHESYLELTKLREAEGDFIDTKIFPPVRIRDRKKKEDAA